MMSSEAKSQHLDADWLTHSLITARVIDSTRGHALLSEFQAEQPRANATAFADHLVQLGLLTSYQADRALAGEADTITLGPYQILEPIGGGSVGSMYAAIHRGDQRRYAVKVLPLRSLWKVIGAKKQVEVFAALPNHPAVVPFTDVDTANGRHYLTWPLVEGETLTTRVMKFGALPATDAAALFAQIADGLALCHSSGIIHGLLKPSSLLIGRDGTAKILDLGVGAIVLDNLDDDQSMLDTISTANSALDLLDFAAPETIADPTARTPAADIYSFGCVFYYALCGIAPFPEGSVVDRMIAHQTQAPVNIRVRNPLVPASIASIVDLCLEKNPARRPADMWVVRDLLRAIHPHTEANTDTPTGEAEWRKDHPIGPDYPVPSYTKLNRLTASGPQPVSSNDLGADGRVDFDEPPVEDRVDSVPTVKRAVAANPATIPAEDDRALLDDDNEPALPSLMRELPLPPTSMSMRAIRLSSGLGDKMTSATGEKSPSSDMKSLQAPVKWTEAAQIQQAVLRRPSVKIPEPPLFHSAIMRTAKRLFSFILGTSDVVQLSIFGPPEVMTGQRFELIVYAHAPASLRSVTTLCRALNQNTELLGTGYMTRPVTRGTVIGLHLGLDGAGIAQSLVSFTWIGQMQPRTFEVFVPWESPPGVIEGKVSAGINEILSGKIPLHFVVLPRAR